MTKFSINFKKHCFTCFGTFSPFSKTNDQTQENFWTETWNDRPIHKTLPATAIVPKMSHLPIFNNIRNFLKYPISNVCHQVQFQKKLMNSFKEKF